MAVAPIDAWELAGQIAKSSRPGAHTVAGYDLTFSPVKSVSTLWAVAEPGVAAAIERAHRPRSTTRCASSRQQALFTRTGPHGIRQVNVVAWSRPRSPSATAGPATRIYTPMSRSRTRCRPSTGGGCQSTAGCCSRQRLPHRRPITPLEQHLHDALGIRFAERSGTDPGKRPITRERPDPMCFQAGHAYLRGAPVQPTCPATPRVDRSAGRGQSRQPVTAVNEWTRS
jgi:TrwC relaxase